MIPIYGSTQIIYSSIYCIYISFNELIFRISIILYKSFIYPYLHIYVYIDLNNYSYLCLCSDYLYLHLLYLHIYVFTYHLMN